MNIPNKLSILRLCLIPVYIALFYIEFPLHYLCACAVFGLAAFTDFLDGYLARKLHQITDLGKFLDASADKVLVLSGLIILVDAHVLPYIFGGVFVCVILAREILISCLRMITAAKGIVLAADKLGKAKTTLQDISIVILTFSANFEDFENQMYFFSDNLAYKILFGVGFVCLSLAVIMTIISGIHYFTVDITKLDPVGYTRINGQNQDIND